MNQYPVDDPDPARDYWLDPDASCVLDDRISTLRVLLQAARAPEAVIVLSGAPHSGKTALLAEFLTELTHDSVQVVRLLNPGPEPLSLRRMMAQVGGFESAGGVTPGNVESVFQVLLSASNDSRHIVLAVDDAHTLVPEMLNYLHLLIRLAATDGLLLQLVLFGRPEIWDRLADERLQQLRQKIVVRREIRWSDLDDTIELGIPGMTPMVDVSQRQVVTGWRPPVVQPAPREWRAHAMTAVLGLALLAISATRDQSTMWEPQVAHDSDVALESRVPTPRGLAVTADEPAVIPTIARDEAVSNVATAAIRPAPEPSPNGPSPAAVAPLTATLAPALPASATLPTVSTSPEPVIPAAAAVAVAAVTSPPQQTPAIIDTTQVSPATPAPAEVETVAAPVAVKPDAQPAPLTVAAIPDAPVAPPAIGASPDAPAVAAPAPAVAPEPVAAPKLATVADEPATAAPTVVAAADPSGLPHDANAPAPAPQPDPSQAQAPPADPVANPPAADVAPTPPAFAPARPAAGPPIVVTANRPAHHKAASMNRVREMLASAPRPYWCDRATPNSDATRAYFAEQCAR